MTTRLLVAAATFLALCAVSAKHELTVYPCPAGIPSGAHCVTLRVVEDRAAGTGRRIDVAAVVLPATQRNAGPIFPIAGGPGESTIDDIPIFLSDLGPAVRAHHDIVFVDQRGTGSSHALDCPTLYADRKTFFAELIPLTEVSKCRSALATSANLAAYGTDAAADDLDDFRAALGYERVELFGTSYGSAVAQVYARRHPMQVRTLLLQSVDMLDSRPPLPYAAGAQRALDDVMAACAGQPPCRHAFPNLHSHFRTLLARFNSGPLPVSVRNLQDDSTQDYRLSKAVFADRLRQILYSPASAAIAPLIIERAYDGDTKPLATSIAFLTKQLENGIDQGEWLSVTCSENIPFIKNSDIAAASANSFLGDLRVRAQQAACKVWNVPSVSAKFITPVRTNAPVLMISASNDPATPGQLAKGLLRYMPNARQVIVPNGGHENSSPCLTGIIGSFLDSPNTKLVNAACLHSSMRPPFITDESVFWNLLKSAGA